MWEQNGPIFHLSVENMDMCNYIVGVYWLGTLQIDSFLIFFNQGFYFTISENFVWNVLGIQWECIFPIHSEVQKPAWHCLCSKLYFPWILCITGWGVRSKPGAHSSSACMIHCHLLIIFFSMAPKQGQHLTEGCKIKKKGVLVWLN